MCSLSRSGVTTMFAISEEESNDIQLPIQLKHCFDKISSQIIKQILKHLPLSDKKSARLVNHEWVAIVNELVTINLPKLNDQSRQEICAHIGTAEYSHLHVTKLTDNLESWSTMTFHHGPKIVSIIFENPEISTDNMIWLLTQCYSVKEIQFSITAREDVELEKKKLRGLFQNVETMKAINISSRTLRSVVIKCCSKNEDEKSNHDHEERAHDGQEINISTMTPTTSSISDESSPSSPTPPTNTSSTFYFDCCIFRNCRLLHSILIIQLPDLKLKHLDDLPMQIGHVVLQFQQTNNNNNNCENHRLQTNGSSNSNGIGVRNIGFIDFSGPVYLKTFQSIFRLPKIRKYCDQCLLSAQDVVVLLPKLRGVSKIAWSSDIQHYKIQEKIK